MISSLFLPGLSFLPAQGAHRFHPKPHMPWNAHSRGHWPEIRKCWDGMVRAMVGALLRILRAKPYQLKSPSLACPHLSRPGRFWWSYMERILNPNVPAASWADFLSQHPPPKVCPAEARAKRQRVRPRKTAGMWVRPAVLTTALGTGHKSWCRGLVWRSSFTSDPLIQPITRPRWLCAGSVPGAGVAERVGRPSE